MLHRASIAQIKDGQITKSNGHLVVAMRVYPRFLPKALVDEYLKELAPAPALFARYREFKKHGMSQNDSFQSADYEQEFELGVAGMNDLQRLAELSRSRDVYLICQCAKDEYCHVDLMLILAQRRFGAAIEKLAYDYPGFRDRMMG